MGCEVRLRLGRAEQPQLRQRLFPCGRILLVLGDPDQFIFGLRIEESHDDGPLGIGCRLGIEHLELLPSAGLAEGDNGHVANTRIGF